MKKFASSARKKAAVLLLLLLIMPQLVCCGQSTAKLKNEYIWNIRGEADGYCHELCDTACGKPYGSMTIDFAVASDDFLKAKKKSFAALLHDGRNILLIGLAPGEGGYSDEDIRKIVKEAYSRQITLYLFFNNNDKEIYRITPDGVKVDRTLSADGGKMHALDDYDLGD